MYLDIVFVTFGHWIFYGYVKGWLYLSYYRFKNELMSLVCSVLVSCMCVLLIVLFLFLDWKMIVLGW